jgi:hypothetical protein
MSTRAFLQFLGSSGSRWRHGEVDTDLARERARAIISRGVQENVALVLVHVDPAKGERKVEPLQLPPWFSVDLTDDAAGVQVFVKGEF